MAQILRPAATTLSTRIASGNHTAIDEVTPNDGDYIQSQSVTSSQSATYECRLSPPVGIPEPGTGTLRLRGYAQDGGSNVLVSLRQGDTQLEFENTAYSSLSISTFEYEFDLSGITDWGDVRIRLHFARNNANTGWYRTHWLEFEVPDATPGDGAWFQFF